MRALPILQMSVALDPRYVYPGSKEMLCGTLFLLLSMTSVAEISKDSQMFNVVTAMTMIQNQRPRNRE